MSPDAVTIERLPKSRVLCTLRIEEEAYRPVEEETLQLLGAQVHIDGFRPGHAPATLLREKVPAERLFEESVRELLKRMLPSVLQEHALSPIIPPQIEIASRLPLTVKVTIVEQPEVRFKKAAALTIPKEEPTVRREDKERIIRSVLHDYRTVKPVDRPAAKDDQVIIDLRATDETDAAIEGLHATDYVVTIGSGQLLPGMEDALVGLKANDQKTFTLTLPEKFPVETLQGKPAIFHITMKRVEEVKLPELTDAFVKEHLHADSVEEFHKQVEASLRGQEEQFLRMSRERKLLDAIRAQTDVDLADELIDTEMRALISEWSDRLTQQGSSLEEALKKEGKKPETVQEELRTQAIDRWKLRFGISALIKERAISVTDAELENAWQQYLERIPAAERDSAAKEWEKRGPLYDDVRWRTLVEKTIDSLLD